MMSTLYYFIQPGPLILTNTNALNFRLLFPEPAIHKLSLFHALTLLAQKGHKFISLCRQQLQFYFLSFICLKYFKYFCNIQYTKIQKFPHPSSMFTSKQSQKIQQNQLDMSSIDDDSKEHSQASSQLIIQEMGLNPLEDEESFKNNLRELLLTDEVEHCAEGKSSKKNEDGGSCNHSNQFSGEPLKGSFLREMEILGKTLSFESTCHNIYQDCYENEQVLSSLAEQVTIKSTLMLELIFTNRNLQKNAGQLEAKYVVDFCKPLKQKKPSSKCKNDRKKETQTKKMLTDAQNSTKSMSNYLDRAYSQKKISKNKNSNKSLKKNRKHNEQQILKSNFSGNYGKMVKRSRSPLRKVGYSSVLTTQILKPKPTFSNSVLERQARKKKIEQKLNLRKKI